MIISMHFTCKNNRIRIHATRTISVKTDTPVSQVDVLNNPSFIILPQIKPGQNKRSAEVVKTVSDDSVVPVKYLKMFTSLQTPYGSPSWIKRRIKELTNEGWQVTSTGL